jgi:uncharacterized LabA/DUF88 family protein
MIDGGHVRVVARQADRQYTPELVEQLAHACVRADERLLRILYYDCARYAGTTRKPVSGAAHSFTGDDAWLKQLASKDHFAVRQGVLKFRGWKLKARVARQGQGPLTDNDFAPDFEQKGVDMRIGLDIANFCRTSAVERVILFTNDTDYIPAMKYGRIAGLQIVLASLPRIRTAKELLWHSDFERRVEWPT